MKTLVLGAVLVGLMSGGAVAQTIDDQYQSPIPEERTFLRNSDKYEGLVPDVGREETFHTFKGCFKIGWIKRQKLTRTEWELAVDQMAKECSMEPLEAEEKAIIVEYLARNYGRRR